MSSSNLPEQSYDERENVMRIWHPTPVALDTRQRLVTYFDAVVQFWRRSCRGRKAYYLVDWTNFTTNMRENEAYANNVKRVVDECAITIVRYGDNPLQRTAGRLVAVKLHVPSHIYETQVEALEVIRGLQQGTVRLSTS